MRPATVVQMRLQSVCGEGFDATGDLALTLVPDATNLPDAPGIAVTRAKCDKVTDLQSGGPSARCRHPCLLPAGDGSGVRETVMAAFMI